MGRWEGRRDRGKQPLRDRRPREVAERRGRETGRQLEGVLSLSGFCPPVPASLGVSPIIGWEASDGFLVFRLTAADPDSAPAGGACGRRKQPSQLY